MTFSSDWTGGYIQTDKSAQAARQAKRRVPSALASSQPWPGSPGQYPAWVFRKKSFDFGTFRTPFYFGIQQMYS